MAFFFKSKKPVQQNNSQDLNKRLAETIQQMRITAENLDKRTEHLMRNVDDCRRKGKELMAKKKKDEAKYQVILMKKYEKEMNSLQGKKLNLETQIMALESTSVDKDILAAMRAGRDMMRAVVNDQNLDEAHDLMDDIQDTYAQQEELSSALARQVGEEIEITDEDLLAAFEDEQEEEAVEEATYDFDSMPEVPKKPVTKEEPKVSEVDQEAAELAALMNM